MWIEYDRETSHPPKSGIYIFELQAIDRPFIKIKNSPCSYDFFKRTVDPILDFGGWDYSKFKPTHFYLIPDRE